MPAQPTVVLAEITNRRRTRKASEATRFSDALTDAPDIPAVSVRVSRLGPLSGWRRWSWLVTRFSNDPLLRCLSSDVCGQRGRCRPGARLLA